MTDERRFDREARAWLEEGPLRAPDRVVTAALLEIDQTPQERGLRVLRRLPFMSSTVRLAAVAAVIVVAVGLGYALTRSSPPGIGSSTPSPRSSEGGAPSGAPSAEGTLGGVAAFKLERDRICTAGTAARDALKPRMLTVYDEAQSQTVRADGIAAIDEFIAMEAPLLEELASLTPPESLHDAHVANIQQYRDQLTLIREISRRLHLGDFAGARPIDEATDLFTGEIQDWEAGYNFLPCP